MISTLAHPLSISTYLTKFGDMGNELEMEVWFDVE
jgi:hypothetical protein